MRDSIRTRKPAAGPPHARGDLRGPTTSGRRAARFAPWAVGVLAVGLLFAGCESGSSSGSGQPTNPPTAHSASTHSTSTTAATTAPTSPPTTAAVTTGSSGMSNCPTAAAVSTAVGTSFTSMMNRPGPAGSAICIYNGAPGSNAEVAVFAHQNPSVYSGQVANSPGKPAMPPIAGLGDGAYGQDIAGRSVVNAYSNASRTLVAAQAAAPLTAVEALAKVALAANG